MHVYKINKSDLRQQVKAGKQQYTQQTTTTTDNYNYYLEARTYEP